jgi:hypothetical protein
VEKPSACAVRVKAAPTKGNPFSTEVIQ